MMFKLDAAEVDALRSFLGEVLATTRNETITQIYERLLDEPVPCIECHDLLDPYIAVEELGYCVTCSNNYFDHKERVAQIDNLRN